MANQQDIETCISGFGIVPVVVLDDAADAEQLAEALIAGGLPCVEVTFRTAAAEDAIRRMVSAHPDMLVGAGTILSISQAITAVQAGAKFIVSPGFDCELVDWCLENKVPVFPGILTPSELMQAHKRGLNVVKFFPAGQFGGLDAITALGAPFSDIRFMPTGGVNESNLGDYLASEKVAACGGTWLAKKAMIRAGDFAAIEANVRNAVALVAEARV